MGIKNFLNHPQLADSQLDEITNQKVASFVETRHTRALQVSTINRQLEVLRRLLKLAVEWGKLDKVPPKVEMLPGERHRDRVLTFGDRDSYGSAWHRNFRDVEMLAAFFRFVGHTPQIVCNRADGLASLSKSNELWVKAITRGGSGQNRLGREVPRATRQPVPRAA